MSVVEMSEANGRVVPAVDAAPKPAGTVPVDLSIVIPIYNENETLPELRRRLFAVLDQLGPLRSEVLFVNDGSGDGSQKLLREIAAEEPRVRVIHFTRNFGHHAAVTAGLDRARGRYVAMMDGDLQDRPEELPKLLNALKANPEADVVYGVRTNRQDPWAKRLTSSAFVKIMRVIVGGEIPMNTSTYRVMSRRCVNALIQCRERSRFLAGLTAWLGFKKALS